MEHSQRGERRQLRHPTQSYTQIALLLFRSSTLPDNLLLPGSGGFGNPGHHCLPIANSRRAMTLGEKPFERHAGTQDDSLCAESGRPLTCEEASSPLMPFYHRQAQGAESSLGVDVHASQLFVDIITKPSGSRSVLSPRSISFQHDLISFFLVALAFCICRVRCRLWGGLQGMATPVRMLVPLPLDIFPANIAQPLLTLGLARVSGGLLSDRWADGYDCH
jgi:hypothetical protein